MLSNVVLAEPQAKLSSGWAWLHFDSNQTAKQITIYLFALPTRTRSWVARAADYPCVHLLPLLLYTRAGTQQCDRSWSGLCGRIYLKTLKFKSSSSSSSKMNSSGAAQPSAEQTLIRLRLRLCVINRFNLAYTVKPLLSQVNAYVAQKSCHVVPEPERDTDTISGTFLCQASTCCSSLSVRQLDSDPVILARTKRWARYSFGNIYWIYSLPKPKVQLDFQSPSGWVRNLRYASSCWLSRHPASKYPANRPSCRLRRRSESLLGHGASDLVSIF